MGWVWVIPNMREIKRENEREELESDQQRLGIAVQVRRPTGGGLDRSAAV